MKKLDLEIVFNRVGVKPNDKFYSTVYGEIYYNGKESYFSDVILTFKKTTTNHWSNTIDIKYNTEGVLFGSEYKLGEMTLFPTKDIRDWDKWVELKCYQGDVGIGDYVVGLYGDNGTIKNMFQKVFKVLDVTDTHFNCVCVCGKDDVDKTIEIRKDCVKKHDFIPNVYTEGMPVLVRNYGVEDIWLVDIFHSYCCNGTYMCGKTSKDRRVYSQCIPYNSETYKLVLTNKDCPPFYKRW